MVKKLENVTQNNFRDEVIKNPGGFCSLFDLKKLKYKDPILLSSSDGVGTKLKIALDLEKFDFIGIDLVAMCVNDILASGGEPLFFLDYFSSSKIIDSHFLKIIKSINSGCIESGCSLIGGETAEMPGIYKKNDFDLAGFAIGAVERNNLILKKNVMNGAVLLGLESSGFHSNGFSLIRKMLKRNRLRLDSEVPFKSNKKIIGEDLLIPTKIYVNELLPLVKKNLIASMAHITGGGIYENLSRVIPMKFAGVIETEKFSIPERFLWLKNIAKISKIEMLNTFNCGIGMLMIINKENEKKVVQFLNKQSLKFFKLGKIKKNSKNSNNVCIRKFGEWHLT